MKKLRHPFIARVVMLYFFLETGFSTQQATAQWVVADLIQDINTVIQTASQAVNEYTTIKDAIEHSVFYKSLKAISNGVQTYRKVQGIIDSEQAILNSAVNNLTSLRTNRYLTVPQIAGMIRMYKYFIDQSIANAKELTRILSPAFFQMSDAERLDFIDKIQIRTTELDHHLNYYNTMNLALVNEQQLKTDDLNQVTAFYAARKSAQIDPTVAHERMGGFYGSIVNLLYSASAIAALIGALRVYGQFTSGDQGVFQTATGWFGSVLLSVLITTFLKMLFF